MGFQTQFDVWQHALGGTTAEQLTDFADGVVPSGSLKALASNSAAIYLGKSDVSSSNGYPLDPGEAIPIENITTVNNIYIRGASGDKVAFIGSY